MITLQEIKKEHSIMLGYLKELDLLSSGSSNFSKEEVIALLGNIFSLWNKHERKEEELFKNIGKDFPVKKMNIAHKQLNGHWKVCELALESKDKNKINIALDTDGKMFINKLKKHIEIEEKLFDKLLFV